MIRFPKWCGKCQTWDHYAKDCTRVPGLGNSQEEKDMVRMVARDREKILAAAGAVILVLVIFGMMGG